ncbi:MAG TPA: exodeoxyribonuclease VII large subunit [Nevskiaceae bacterium]|nr:exodeoxyribonuclease VII large subunit [Nevskiaceae bacterium]
MPTARTDDRPIHTVSELAELLQAMLEDSLPSLWVQGEISNFRNPSGHWYFTLKDEHAQIKCAMFKNTNFYVRPQPKDGDHVLIRGRVGYYVARGELQIVAEHLEPAGSGALLAAFEALKKKLAAEGLFDEKLKRPIPRLPRAIGLITSRTGAAIQDVVTTLRRRYPLGSVFLYPVPVQGETAPPAIVKALRELPQLAPVDVILLARGGGSIEDLWCFNDERVARAIRASPVPVVTGIGHEIDFTIADFASDLRAPTPTAAAELVSPDRAELGKRVEQMEVRLARRMGGALQEQVYRAQRSHQRLTQLHPSRRLQQHAQRLDELIERLSRIPRPRIDRLRSLLGARRQILSLQLQRRFGAARQSAVRAADLLGSFNPTAILERGYAIARKADGAIVRDVAQLAIDETLDVQFARGSADVQVSRKR